MPLPRHLTRPPAPRGNYAPPPGGDSGRDPFSVVFAITGETTYKGEQAWTGHEVWKFGDGTTTEVVNGHVLTTSQPGLTLDDTEFDVDADPPQLALGRLGPGAGGRVWELVAYGAGAAATACRSLLVGLGADSALAAEVAPGSGKCANVEGATVYGAYDAAVGTGTAGGWEFAPFATRAGATVLRVFLDERGNPAATLTDDDANTRYMTFEGCVGGRMKFTHFDCLWCEDAWDGPCGSNQITIYVSCAALPSCASCDLIGASVTTVDNLGRTLTGTWAVEYGRPTLRLGQGDSTSWVIICDPVTGVAYYGGDPANVVTVTPTGSPGAPAELTFTWPDTSTEAPADQMGFVVTCGAAGSFDPCGDATGSGAGSDVDPCNGPGEPLENGSTALEAVIPDGPNAGTYTLTATVPGFRWENGAVPIVVEFVGDSCATGWKVATAGEDAQACATAAACSPVFGLVFPGAIFGAAGDVTVSVA